MVKGEMIVLAIFAIVVCGLFFLLLYALSLVFDELIRYKIKKKAKVAIKNIFVSEGDKEFSDIERELNGLLKNKLHPDKELKKRFQDIPNLLQWYLTDMNCNTEKVQEEEFLLKKEMLVFLKEYEACESDIFRKFSFMEKAILEDFLNNSVIENRAKELKMISLIVTVLQEREDAINELQLYHKNGNRTTIISIVVTVIAPILTLILDKIL